VPTIAAIEPHNSTVVARPAIICFTTWDYSLNGPTRPLGDLLGGGPPGEQR
jgi:hypothetical protein